jgi:hypothetical protein
MKQGNLYEYFIVGSTWNQSYEDMLADWRRQLDNWLKFYGEDDCAVYLRHQIEALEALDDDARAYIDWYASEMN